MTSQVTRTTAQKLSLFRTCFSGLPGVYGTYSPATGQASQVKESVTDQVFLEHLLGRRPYGVYLLEGDRTKAVVVDFDLEDRTLPADFLARASHYQLPAYIERSKSKGYHVWIFLAEPGVTAAKARLVNKQILEDMDLSEVEIFPKQDALTPSAPFGNFINAPLFGKLVPQGRSVFVDPVTFEPYPDQWAVLEAIQRVPEALLDELIEMNGWVYTKPQDAVPSAQAVGKPGEPRPLLPPCAVKMLTNGVTQNQRVSCFRLAVHFKRVGLPFDLAVAALKVWALKNRPLADKQVISEDQIIKQAQGAYNGSYKGCGCGSPAVAPFCQSTCALYTRHTPIEERQGRTAANCDVL